MFEGELPSVPYPPDTKARLGSRMSVNAAGPARFLSRSRTPLMKPIILSDQERRDLIAFLETLTGMPEAETPPKLPARR
jgi:hypothetical protein